MTPFDALVLGVIEGITEFLPISSTGHLILASSLLQIQSSDFTKSFDIVIQLGAILAVVALYLRSFFNIEVIKRLIVAFIPTGIIGLTFYKLAKEYLLGNDMVVVVALAIGGLALITFELTHKESEDATSDIVSISYRQALAIGLFQAIAIVPGVSRSAATILGGLMLGIKRITIVEFSFLLAVPTMAAASGLDLLKNYSSFSQANILTLSIGFVVSFVVALGSIRWLLGYVRNHSFIGFGVYRIAVAVLFFFFVL